MCVFTLDDGEHDMDGGQAAVDDDAIKDRQKAVEPELTSFNRMAEALNRPWRLVRAPERGFALVHYPPRDGQAILHDLSGARSAFEAVAKAGMFLGNYSTSQAAGD